MRLIDKIALHRAIKTLLDFILAVLKIFEKQLPSNNVSPIKPSIEPSIKPKRKVVKKILDNILPWRNINE
jgi:hypothetical protein